jgi:LysM repeat protein
MVTRQHSVAPIGDDPSLVRARAHDSRVYLVRLLLIAALTGIVVGVWSVSDDDASPRVLTSAVTQGQVEGNGVVRNSITAPTPEVRAAQSAPITPTASVVTPLPNAIPRPPEFSEPETPSDFIRFIVQRGDTVFDISLVYGVAVEDLLRFNPNLGDGTRVDVGQAVMIPVLDE